MLTDGQTNERKNGRGEANRRFSPMWKRPKTAYIRIKLRKLHIGYSL
jgi:hypothetical protein